MTWIPRTFYLIGCWLLLFASLQMIPAFYAFAVGQSLIFDSFVLSIFINGFIGATLYFGYQDAKRSKSLRVMILLPFLAYTVTGFGSALPFVFYYNDTDVWLIFFEGISMITTMGVSALREGIVEPYALVLWRALASWCGGFSIVVMALTFLMRMNVGAMQLYPSDFAKRNKGAALGSISSVSKNLFVPFFIFTLLAIIIFLIAGEGLGQSLIRGLTAVSTAGIVMSNELSATVSTLPVQFAYCIILTAALINIDVLYSLWRGETSKRKIKSIEYKILPIFLMWGMGGLLVIHFITGAGTSLIDKYFMLVSTMSTTGYSLHDWPVGDAAGLASSFMFLVFALIGGGVLTTTGGIGQMRFLILIVQSRSEISRLAHPNGVYNIKFGRNNLQNHDMNAVWMLVAGFLLTFILGTILISISGNGIQDSVAMTISAMTTSGSFVSVLSPYFPGFSGLGDFEYIVLSLLMLFGRLETSLILILGARLLWRR